MSCSGLSLGDDGESVGHVRRQVLERGWAVAYVDGMDERTPPYGYTVGLSRWKHPELIMFGDHPECCVAVLNRIAGLVRAGVTFDEGDDLAVALPEYDLPPAALRFPDSSTHLYLANLFYRSADGQSVPALQILFPDREPLLNPDALPRPP